MSLATLISIVVIGLILIVVEVILIPGTTLVGILGSIITAVGVYFGYADHSATTGNIILGVSLGIIALIFFLAIKLKVWNWFSLKKEIDGKLDSAFDTGLKEGDEGVAVSDLRPMGSADFNDQVVEVSTIGTFLKSGTKVKIVSVEKNKIYVEPKA